ncbi:hypothetical protein C1H76_5759 [Elsinoe australis]|uniref:Uncharacterized protein n=1 Tax=Elsinoe australis TaxID=40998 RepID=A0A4U7B093_9PEZI|nr:hypothetical protein C1H76_5759 [Elsinoe australis]
MSGAAVNVPTNFKVKEQDVNAKLQLYGIYSAFANGKVPSNKQIDVALNSVLAKSALSSPSKKLSAEGQKLVSDLRDVIEQAKILLLTKNEGNLLQDFIWQTQQISGGDASVPNAPVDKDTAKQHGNQALDGLRTLGTLIISNGQFRKLLKDATTLARDIAGDAAQKAATRINPNEEDLAQIDRPAEDNTWHDVPDMSKDNLRSQWEDRKPFKKQDAHTAADRAQDAAQRPDGRVSGTAGAQEGADNLQRTIDDNVSEDTKNRAREYRERTQNYMKDKIPQERRDQTIWRLKKMVAEVQGHQDYQQAIETLLRLAEEYAGHGRNVADQSAGTVKGAHTDNSLKTAETDLKTIIERFANSTSLDDVFDSINQIYRDADRDPELKDWFKKIDSYIRRCLQEQGFVLQDAATDEWNQLYDQGNFLLRDRYRNHTDRVLDELKFYVDQFDKDPLNKRFGESMNKLFLDLGNDENGQAQFKPHLVKDLTDVILPAFFENIRYVPIPRIEYKDPMIDLVVENLVLEGDNLAPNVLEFGSDNYWRWGRKKISNKNKNKVMLAVSGVQCDLRDVSFYVKKKEGFPSVTDKGVMDVILGGEGLSFKVAMETADSKDKNHFFKVNKVDVSVKNMNIIMKQSNHKLLFKMFKPLLLKVMNPVVQKAVEKQVRDSIEQLDSMLYAVHQEAEKTKADLQRNPDPEYAQNIYQRYVSAFNKRMTQAKQKKEEVQKNTEVNMAVTQHDSIFPNIKLPGGISTKATEYKDLARKGDKWESPVFSIGSAKESSNLPSLSKVTRKPHSANMGGANNGPLSSGTGATGTGLNQSSAPGYGTQGSSAPGYGTQGTSAPGYGAQGISNQGQGMAPQSYGNQGSVPHSQGEGYTIGQPLAQQGHGLQPQGFSNQVDEAFKPAQTGLSNGGAGLPPTQNPNNAL